MEFYFNCEKILGSDSNGITIIEPSHKNFLQINIFMHISEIIDAVGSFSATVRYI
jgi:hypothetical protein